jgi:hypothetical protein
MISIVLLETLHLGIPSLYPPNNLRQTPLDLSASKPSLLRLLQLEVSYEYYLYPEELRSGISPSLKRMFSVRLRLLPSGNIDKRAFAYQNPSRKQSTVSAPPL